MSRQEREEAELCAREAGSASIRVHRADVRLNSIRLLSQGPKARMRLEHFADLPDQRMHPGVAKRQVCPRELELRLKREPREQPLRQKRPNAFGLGEMGVRLL